MWDNYGESMYHDTQGIVIQNEVLEISSSTETPTTSSRNQSSTTSALFSVKAESKRSLEIPNIELEPVRKKLKISQFSSIMQTMDNPVNYKTLCSERCGMDIILRNKQTSTNVVWLELHNNKRSFTISKNWIFGNHWSTSNTA